MGGWSAFLGCFVGEGGGCGWRYNKNGSRLFGVEEEVGRCAFEGAVDARFGHRGVVEGVPSVVEGIPAVRSVVAEIDVPRMIDHAHQLIDGIFGAGMVGERDEAGEVEGLADPDAVGELLLAELAEGEALDLQDEDGGEAVEVELPPALAEG